MLDQLSQKLSPRLMALIIMCLWGGIVLWSGLMRFDAFGLDEGAAIALLLNWSVSDNVISTVIALGGPDFRALLLVPLGLYWSGSMIAAKVFTLMITFSAAMVLYSWSKAREGKNDEETALIATGLFLVAPVTIGLANSMSTGPFLLLLFGLGWILDKKYRASEHRISSLYFLQTILVAITVTLHPMGLAYPLALAWHWHINPKSDMQKKQVWAGIAIATGIILAMQTGWVALAWLENPLTSLSYAILGNRTANPADISAWAGLIPAILLLMVLYRQGKALLDNLLGTMFLLALLLGLVVADANWAMIALAVILYCGTPLLIQVNKLFGQHAGFLGQRGLVMFVLFITATLFMQADRGIMIQQASGLLSPEDELISELIPEAAQKDRAFLAASQWPARTMLAVRSDVLPLPPVASDGPAQLEMIKNITHVMFDHNDPDNTGLTRNFRDITGATETLSRMPGGVIIRIREAASKPAHEPVPVAPVENDTPTVPVTK
ncbi:hypothetical protein [Kaarinaea lacus]